MSTTSNYLVSIKRKCILNGIKEMPHVVNATLISASMTDKTIVGIYVTPTSCIAKDSLKRNLEARYIADASIIEQGKGIKILFND